MLKELQLTNFKSFAGDAEPIPFAPVTILVGANASGKSNVFDAVRFLQGIGMGLSIAEILTGKLEGGREVQPGLRGGTEEVCWAGEDAFTLQTKGDFRAVAEILPGRDRPEGIRRLFDHRMTCRARPRPEVQDELLHVE